jgi:hypothetical protein
MANYTPTSGVAWDHNADYTAGVFAFGMESTPTGPDPDQITATATHVENIPYSITSLELINGTITMQGNRKAAVLIRIAVIGDPSQGDGGFGMPGSALLFNEVLNVGGENPQTVSIPPFKFDDIQHFIQVPSNGGPYQLGISMQFSGAEWPQDAEIELNGRWTA